MKRVRAIATDETAAVITEWAAQLRGGTRNLDEACTLALDEFAKDRKALLEKLRDALRAKAGVRP